MVLALAFSVSRTCCSTGSASSAMILSSPADLVKCQRLEGASLLNVGARAGASHTLLRTTPPVRTTVSNCTSAGKEVRGGRVGPSRKEPRASRVQAVMSSAPSSESLGHQSELEHDDEEPTLFESWLEQRVFNSRFLTLTAVVGSLVGATLCFVKGSIFVAESVKYFFCHVMSHRTERVIMYLVEALDVYLMGTVMLIFGMGLYELFIDSHLTSQKPRSSSLFGLFPLRSRPKWLNISSLDEMKSKLGHVIVMILLVGMFEKSKKVVITSAPDFLMFSASVALAAACLLMLSKLHDSNAHGSTHEQAPHGSGSGHGNGNGNGNGHGNGNGSPIHLPPPGYGYGYVPLHAMPSPAQVPSN